MKKTYVAELQKIMTDKSPARPTTRTRAQIESSIAEITESLKGPLPNVERLLLIADRNDLRKQLANAK